MLNKFKNIFKSNSSKNSDLAKPKNRELGDALEKELKGSGNFKSDVDTEIGENADDILVMDYEMSKEFKEKAAVKKPTVSIAKHTVHDFASGQGKRTIPVAEYPLDELVAATLKQFAPIIIKKGIRLDYEGLDIKITTNKEVMLFILQEIISNAINHVLAGEIRIYVLNDQLLVIEDNGIGIPPEELPKIFEEGFVGSKSTNRDSLEGVGLYKTAIALEKMAYPYEVQSALGQGTGFAIKIK